jgi:hypothetical protein
MTLMSFKVWTAPSRRTFITRTRALPYRWSITFVIAAQN